MSEHQQTKARLKQIKERLNALGAVGTWKSDIDSETGDLILYLPEQFRMPGGLVLENMEGSTSADHALLDFLGDAPHAILFLLSLTVDRGRYVQHLEEQVRELEEKLRQAQAREIVDAYRSVR